MRTISIMSLLLALSATVNACGGAYTVTVPPVQVNVHVDVVHSLDLTTVTNAFLALCRQELGTTATDAQIRDCSEAKLGLFVEAVQSLFQQSNQTP